ncbi:acetylxylan esterase [Streptomyces nitrosporeus]|uniref:Acetylxylan esterase n=1 Tax=Streptomyces nitrosporeus TaxID=28894 RepID=A0A5J6FJK7_9ACTN|nr:acetylxylan esterase [Streptomyces nitrosporeus]QEU76171.1 acetylxylan esterase [Streptomyces nitrosporeus]GGZ08429.1 acetylxylan esterase [Streptomyces nitrosporeus]
MALFDLPLDELRTYRSRSAEPEDFDAFWSATLDEARTHALDARFEPLTDTGLKTVEVYDVTFAGFGGHPVKGWFLVPAGATGPLPVAVEFIGYGGGRGLPHSHLLWASAGIAHFVMDSRGQGSGWAPGHTADPVGSAPSLPGFMTRGIEDPSTYYYRRLITDGVRAVEAARSHRLADPSRTAVVGASQGGGLALAVGGLVPDLAAVAPDVPFLCDFPRATRMTDRMPYREIGDYLKTHRGRTEQADRTLAYFDGVHFAARGRAPALFSVALEDQTCPPSTVFAAFNAYAHPEKEIEVYDFNDHEGGGAFQQAVQLARLPRLLKA